MMRKENRCVNLTCYKVKVDGYEMSATVDCAWYGSVRAAYADLFAALVAAYWDKPTNPHYGLIERHTITFRHDVRYEEDLGFDIYKRNFDLLDGDDVVDCRNERGVFKIVDKMLPVIKAKDDGRQWCDYVSPLTVEMKPTRRVVHNYNAPFSMSYGNELINWQMSLANDEPYGYIWLRSERKKEY